MLTILLPALIALVGLLMYALCANPKLARIGEILFFVGMFWVTYLLGSKTFTISKAGKAQVNYSACGNLRQSGSRS